MPISKTPRLRRRDFLRAGLYAGALLPANRAKAASAPLASYVDPLPIPPVIRGSDYSGRAVPVRMQAFQHKAHRDLPEATAWGYNGSWPGPTFEVRKDEPLQVHWINKLPEKHCFPIDTSIHGAEAKWPEVRAVVHLHGGKNLPEDDGYPDAWSTADGKTGSFYNPKPHVYANDQAATSLWYHDHAMGITRLNVYAGLSGFYFIRDAEEDALNLPNGSFEIPLMIQDRRFDANGSLLYPRAQNGTHPVWMQELFGDVVCVNGKVKPYLQVEPRKYRFRMLNASNSRFFHVSLLPADATGKPKGSVADAPPFHQIGSDGGLLPAPRTLHFLVMSPAERFDVVIDFSGHEGAHFAMTNDAPAPYTRGGEVAAAEVMLFKVTKPLSKPDTSSLPAELVPFEPLNPAEAATERMLGITEMDRPSDGYTMMGMLGGKHWDDPVTENPQAGSLEVWSFVNATGDVHPIHVHLVRFQVLNRQPFDTKVYSDSGRVTTTGIPIPAEANERPAWKDVIKTYPGYITRVIQRFDLPAGTATKPGQEFRYVWHCHMLEHEDNEMMRPYNVVVGEAAATAKA